MLCFFRPASLQGSRASLIFWCSTLSSLAREIQTEHLLMLWYCSTNLSTESPTKEMELAIIAIPECNHFGYFSRLKSVHRIATFWYSNRQGS